MRIRVLAGIVLALAMVAPGARAAAQNGPAAWKPGPAVYGVHKTGNVPVVMSDGTVLRADVYRPADLSTGRLASGQNFPVLLTQTPYNKNAGLTSLTTI